MLELFYHPWPYLVAGIHLVLGVTASAHAILHKTDSRAAIGWVGIIWLTPLLGSLLYVTFGVNRIHRRAHTLRPVSLSRKAPSDQQPGHHPAAISEYLAEEDSNLDSLVQLVGELTQRPLLPGNEVTPLFAGEQAFPAMLEAIDGAKKSITFSTYIFDNDRAGKMFLEHLADAVRRDVQVRVLVDDVGLRYTWPPMVRALRRSGIPVARFMPTLVPWRFPYANLRNHRKIMVVDGQLGFTGGMNIREGNLLELKTRAPVQDMHFRIRGPVVAHLQETFADDWAFCTNEELVGDPWFVPLDLPGQVFARGISDGPDEDFDKLRLTLLGALNCASSSVLIMTPYFLPDESTLATLNVAAMRGVEVHIVLPRVNNLTLVKWASMATLRYLLDSGCKVWFSPPPFEHTKLMVVDGIWTLVGSANWDPRSMRLNFEFNVECYDRHLARAMGDFIRNRIGQSEAVLAEQLNSRNILLRLRDGVAWLASPYL